MKEKLYRAAIELTNNKQTSLLLKWIMTRKLSKRCIPAYRKFYNIELHDVQDPMTSYATLQQFFTRTLKKDARTVDVSPTTVASPVDATIASFGDILDDTTFLVKGKKYKLTDLLGKRAIAEKYRNGQYIVFYLSPANYHRIHSPLNGHVLRQYVLGNRSYPVNDLGLTYGEKPLSHNYRLVTGLDTACGHVAVIKVGAMFVNSIKLTNVTTDWQKGEEVGYFEFGSTVIMLFEPSRTQFLNNVQKNAVIRVGEAFADML